MREANRNTLSGKKVALMIISGAFVFQVMGRRLVEQQNFYNLLAFSIWIIFAFLLSTETFQTMISGKKSIFLSIFILYLLSTGMLSGDYISTIKYIFGFVIVISPIYLVDYIIQYDHNGRLRKCLYYGGLFILSYYAIMTNIMMKRYPTIARQLASGSDTIIQFYYGLNIGGGYSLVYGLMFLTVVLLLRLQKRSGHRIIETAFLALFIITIVKAGYFIALVFMTVGVMMLLLHKKKMVNLLIILFFFIVILGTVLLDMPKVLGNHMVRISLEHEFILEDKVLELGNLLAGNQGDSYVNVEGRLERIKISIDSFLASPFLGNGIYTGYNSNAEEGRIGQHGEWFDALARYGILGMIPLIVFFYHSIKETRAKVPLSRIPFFLFFLLGFVNPVFNFTFVFVLFPIQRLIQEELRADFHADNI